jgi:hypothetical protein
MNLSDYVRRMLIRGLAARALRTTVRLLIVASLAGGAIEISAELADVARGGSGSHVVVSGLSGH